MIYKLEDIKKSEYIKSIIDKYNLPDSFLVNNLSKISRVIDSRKMCNNCFGLRHCRQLSIGERLSLNFDQVLFEEIETCKYEQDREKKESLKNAYLYSNFSDRLIEIDLNSVEYTKDQEQLYLKLAAILHNKTNNGLYIVGNYGVGKTYLCVALANSLVKKNRKVAFVKVADFYREIKTYIGERNDLIGLYIKYLKEAEYLFLDDIGAEVTTSYIRDDILFPVLDYRQENGLITIFTSNLNKSDLLRHYTFDKKESSNIMKANRLMERIDILGEDFVITGKDMRRE